jgi:hypothetical protein
MRSKRPVEEAAGQSAKEKPEPRRTTKELRPTPDPKKKSSGRGHEEKLKGSSGDERKSKLRETRTAGTKRTGRVKEKLSSARSCGSFSRTA